MKSMERPAVESTRTLELANLIEDSGESVVFPGRHGFDIVISRQARPEPVHERWEREGVVEVHKVEPFDAFAMPRMKGVDIAALEAVMAESF